MIAAIPPTPDNVAEMLTDGDNDYHDGNGWHPSLSAAGNVVRIEITPYDAGGDECDPVEFRAVVVEGAQPPIVLARPADPETGSDDDGPELSVFDGWVHLAYPGGMWLRLPPNVALRLAARLACLAEQEAGA